MRATKDFVTVDLLPNYYRPVLEMRELVRIENELFSELYDHFIKALYNQFSKSADLEGIAAYERLLDIIPNPEIESLQFRRDRVLNRMNMNQPFTEKFLRQKLDAIIGVGKYALVIGPEGNVPEYTMKIESSALDQAWFHEIQVLIEQFKPANVEFVNTPLLSESLLVNEKINLSDVLYNYRVGTSWVLGQKPFVSLHDKGVIKMSNTASLTGTFLSTIIVHVAELITQVRLNGTEYLSISPTLVDGEDGASRWVEFEYEVTDALGLENITKIELMDTASTVFTSSSVFIPVGTRIILKHRFGIKEGV